MTESNRKTMLKAGVILAVLAVAVLAMAGAGAADTTTVNITDEAGFVKLFDNTGPNDVKAVLQNNLTLTKIYDLTLTYPTLNLCLNGHTLNLAGNVIAMEKISYRDYAGHLMINYGDENGGTITGGYGGEHGVIYVKANCELDLYGGTITGVSGDKSGAVYVEKKGTFRMHDGTITDTSIKTRVQYYGGAVYNEGTFELSGGSITGNLDKNVTVLNGYGGTFTMTGGDITGNSGTGVVNSVDGTFTMSGGTIANNHINNYYNYNGGGVTNSGTFTMTGGNITGNGAIYHGAGVENYKTFIMTGGSITGNKLNEKDGSKDGAGVHIYGYGSKMTIGGTAEIIDNPAYDGSANNVYLDSKVIQISETDPLTAGARIGVTTVTAPVGGTPVAITSNGSDTDAQYLFSDNSDYTVTFNSDHLELAAYVAKIGDTKYVTLAEAVTAASAGDTITLIANTKENVTINKKVTIDLNGYVLQGNKVWSILVIESGGDVTLQDSNSGNQVHYFSYPGSGDCWTLYSETPSASSSVKVYESADAFSKTEADTFLSTSGNKVYIKITGGVITGGVASGAGGGVNVVSGTFTMTGGSIVGNSAGTTGVSNVGGGVHVAGMFVMTGGSIAGNSADFGGGVFGEGTSTIVITGGTVAGNTAAGIYVGSMYIPGYGGGVHVSGTMTIGGTAKITDNRGTNQATEKIVSNIFLKSEKTITISTETPLASGAGFGVTTQTVPVPGQRVSVTGTNSADCSSFFTSDNRDYLIKDGESHTVLLAAVEIPVTVTTKQTTVQYRNGEAVTTSAENTYPEYKYAAIKSDLKVVYPEGYDAAGYDFNGWYKDEELTEPWNISTDKLTGDTTLYAKLEEMNYNIVYHDGVNIEFEKYVGYTEDKTLKTLSDSRKTFLGWATTEEGSAVYQGGQNVSKLATDGNFNLYAVWKEQTEFTVTFLTNIEQAELTTKEIKNVAKGTSISVNDNTVTIGSYGSSTVSCTSPNYKFFGWSSNGSSLPATVTEDMTILATFVSNGLTGIYVLNDTITFGTQTVGGALPAAKEIIVLNYSDKPITVTSVGCDKFSYNNLPSVIKANSEVYATVQPVTLTEGEYLDTITLSDESGVSPVTITVSLSVIDDSKVEKVNAVVPSSPIVVVTDYIDDEGNDYTLVTAKEIKYEGKTATIPSDSNSNVTVTVKNVSEPVSNTLYLGSDAEISVSYPERQATIPGVFGDPGSYTLTMDINSLNGALPSVSGDFDKNAADVVKASGYTPVITITSLNNGTSLIDENLETIHMDIEIPGKDTLTGTVSIFHVDGEVASKEGISGLSSEFDGTKWNIKADSTAGFSTYVVAYKTDVPSEPVTKSSSSVTSFFGKKNGNDFTFNNAVVITKATLPGATYATVTNTSGSGWYTCNLSTDGTNGTVYFQVPLDVINVKGYTVNDVSLAGCRTTYLKSEGGYAKYSAVITGAGSYTIDFEKDAAQKAVTETKPVTETPKTEEPVKTVETPVTTPVTTEKPATQTATKTPFPILGILAGLGVAGVLLMRRH